MSKSEYYKQVKRIDDAISTGNLSQQVLDLIKEEPYNNYFFKNIDNIKWFSILKKENYFSAEKSPGPKPSDQEGFYSIPWWNVLTYLEKVAEKVNERGNEKYIDELLQIIKAVSAYKDSDGQHVDNYHTWRSFVFILLNIPREKIPIDVIELIPVWLSSRFDTSLVGSELGLKLLPIFLSGEPSSDDITKAEMIVDFITRVKPVKLDEARATLYNKEEEYKLIVDHYWVEEIFKKYSKDIGEKCTNKVIDNLSYTIRLLLKRTERTIPLEFGDKTYLLSLSFNKEKYLVKVIDPGEKTQLDVEQDVILEKKIIGSTLKEISFEEINWNTFVTRIVDELLKEENIASINQNYLKSRVYNLYANFHDQGTYHSFYDESRTPLTDPLEVLTFVLKNILIARAGKHVSGTKEILKRFFDEKYLFFPKMALYIIANNIANYEDMFWNALEGNADYFFYEGLYFGDELKHVLEGLSPLSNEYKEKLKTLIAQGPRRKTGENDDKYILHWKQERYGALKKNSDFKELYESLKSQTGKDAGLHAAVGEIRVRSGGGPAPFTKEDIFKMSNDDLAQKLSIFKAKSFWEGPTVEGLAGLIKDCAAERPGKFIENLSPFINTGFIYIYEILHGVKDAWNNKQNIAWDKLFPFIHHYLNREDFWKDKFIIEKDERFGGANHFWIIGATMDLIQDGTRDDSWAYGEEHFSKAEEIIFLILSKLKAEEEREITDYVTHALNSSHGKTIIALINHALRIARVKDKKGDTSEIRWSDEIKNNYNALLGNKIIESYTMLGRYLPNLFYLDKTWAEEKVNSMYPGTADRYWEAFMDGYLSIGKVYDNLYKLMIPHYHYGITYEFKEKHDNEHLVQHIVIGYLSEHEEITKSDSLFRTVLDNWNPNQILDVVRFFWSQQKYISDEKEKSKKIVEKIISFWKWIFEDIYKSKTDINADDKKILSSIAKLTVFLQQINEEYSQWLLLAAPFVNENYNSSFFIEYLNKFDDPESVKYVGKIFLKMLENFITDFRQENIRSIVEKLYINQNKDDADNICNIYGMKGYEFLRDLYEKYNKM